MKVRIVIKEKLRLVRNGVSWSRLFAKNKQPTSKEISGWQTQAKRGSRIIMLIQSQVDLRAAVKGSNVGFEVPVTGETATDEDATLIKSDGGWVPDENLKEEIRCAILGDRELRSFQEEIDKKVYRLDDEHDMLGSKISEVEDRFQVMEIAGNHGKSPRQAELEKELEVFYERQKAIKHAIKDERIKLYFQYRRHQLRMGDLMLQFAEVLPVDEPLPAGEEESLGHFEVPEVSSASVATIEIGEEGQGGHAEGSLRSSSHDASLPPTPTLKHKPALSDIRRASASSTEKVDHEIRKWKEKKELDDEYHRARNRLIIMSRSFDQWEDDYDTAKLQREQKIAHGEAVVPQEEFDHEMLREQARRTREVIASEEALEIAKATAIAGGVQVSGSDVESGFVDDVDDGYALSSEQEVIASFDRSFVDRWMEATPDGADHDIAPEEPELDAWGADEDDMWDSWSVCEDEKRKKRILDWQLMCAKLKK
jgi:hypothetical protein